MRNEVKSDLQEMKEILRKEWEALTDDDLESITNREDLIHRLQARYGIAREDAERQVQDWAKAA
jgi:uncharacterized protein YjbJ (UPF0337 family)